MEQRHQLTLALPNHPRAPQLARREIASFRRAAHLRGPEFESLRLVVSELVTNAVRHGAAPADQEIGLSVSARGGTIRIEVTDHGPGFSPPRLPAPRSQGGGYGLMIVDRLCSSWGVERNGASKVWCEFDCDGAAASAAGHDAAVAAQALR